jgi:hypothetical protein
MGTVDNFEKKSQVNLMQYLAGRLGWKTLDRTKLIDA